INRALVQRFPPRSPPMNLIVPRRTGSSMPAALAPDLDRAAELALEEKAAATRRAYGSDFRIFEAWCQTRAVSALPADPEAVAAFLAHDAETGSRGGLSSARRRNRQPSFNARPK